MAESGAANQIAYTLVRIFGDKRIHWAMVVIGLLVGLPLSLKWLCALDSDRITVARRTRTSLVLVGCLWWQVFQSFMAWCLHIPRHPWQSPFTS